LGEDQSGPRTICVILRQLSSNSRHLVGPLLAAVFDYYIRLYRLDAIWLEQCFAFIARTVFCLYCWNIVYIVIILQDKFLIHTICYRSNHYVFMSNM